MISDPDISRAAQLIVKRRGADARIVAAQRADELFNEGDLDGTAVWKRILARSRGVAEGEALARGPKERVPKDRHRFCSAQMNNPMVSCRSTGIVLCRARSAEEREMASTARIAAYRLNARESAGPARPGAGRSALRHPPAEFGSTARPTASREIPRES
jgi:hypothetical protein